MSAYRSILETATDYRQRLGWACIPVIGKRPACRWERFQRERPQPSLLKKLFDRDGITGLAVIAGGVSAGLAIRDFDDAGVFDAWLELHPKLADELPVARTRRGGHVYFRGPSGFAELPDGEYRGDSAHYTLAPPSAHPDGGLYSWLNPPRKRLAEVDPLAEGLLPAGHLLAEGKRDTQETHSVSLLCVSLRLCVSADALSAVESAVLRTLPAKRGQRNRAVFRLAARLHGIGGFDPDDDTRCLIVQEWHRRALPVIGTKPFAATWSDFEEAWNRLKRGKSWSIETAAAAAAHKPLPAWLSRYGSPEIQKLAGICAELQRHAGDRPFFLSCRDAGRLIGVDHRCAHKMLHRLKHDGVLDLVKVGTQGTRGRATEWRFIVK